MGVPVVQGPTADLYELCHVCVMIHKGDAYKDQRLVDQVNAAIEKPENVVTYIKVTIKDHWQPEVAITTGPSIYGTNGAVCYNHSAAHDMQKYKEAIEAARKAQAAMRLGMDPNSVK